MTALEASVTGLSTPWEALMRLEKVAPADEAMRAYIGPA
jgi:hypothetical protein